MKFRIVEKRYGPMFKKKEYKIQASRFGLIWRDVELSYDGDALTYGTDLYSDSPNPAKQRIARYYKNIEEKKIVSNWTNIMQVDERSVKDMEVPPEETMDNWFTLPRGIHFGTDPCDNEEDKSEECQENVNMDGSITT